MFINLLLKAHTSFIQRKHAQRFTVHVNDIHVYTSTMLLYMGHDCGVPQPP